MKAAIEEVVGFALDFWRSGLVRPVWEQGEWEIFPTISSMAVDCIQLAISGPRIDGTVEGAAVFVQVPTSKGIPKIKGAYTSPDSDDRSLPSFMLAPLIKYVWCRLFWPGPRDTELWAKSQVAIYFLQREWSRSEEDEAWVWQGCLEPLFRSSKPGRQALEEGTIGFPILRSVVSHYINPVRPGQFQAYIRSIVRRAKIRSFKVRRAENSRAGETSEELLKQERFSAFVRQRRRRGYPGIKRWKGRLSASEHVWTKLAQEWKAVRERALNVKVLAAMMVREGHNEASALRQARRWLREEISPERARARFEAWHQRK